MQVLEAELYPGPSGYEGYAPLQAPALSTYKFSMLTCVIGMATEQPFEKGAIIR